MDFYSNVPETHLELPDSWDFLELALLKSLLDGKENILSLPRLRSHDATDMFWM